jgi:hypothetical protein
LPTVLIVEISAKYLFTFPNLIWAGWARVLWFLQGPGGLTGFLGANEWLEDMNCEACAYSVGIEAAEGEVWPALIFEVDYSNDESA